MRCFEPMCFSVSLSSKTNLLTSKQYYTLLRFLLCPWQFLCLVQHRTRRQLNNNAFVRETVTWILFKLCFSATDTIAFRICSLFSKYNIRNMMYE